MTGNQSNKITRPMSWQEYEAAYRKERPNAISVPAPSKYSYGIAYSLTGSMPMITVDRPEKELMMTRSTKAFGKENKD
ncbi:MAG: hypothetical protein WC602_01070 [archaeon]